MDRREAQGLRALPPIPFIWSSKLLTLNLNHNMLSDLDDSFSQLSSLRELGLHQNRLCQLPLAICRLTRLRVLNIGYNQLEWLPDEMGSLVELRTSCGACSQIQLPTQFTARAEFAARARPSDPEGNGWLPKHTEASSCDAPLSHCIDDAASIFSAVSVAPSPRADITCRSVNRSVWQRLLPEANITRCPSRRPIRSSRGTHGERSKTLAVPHAAARAPTPSVAAASLQSSAA